MGICDPFGGDKPRTPGEGMNQIQLDELKKLVEGK